MMLLLMLWPPRHQTLIIRSEERFVMATQPESLESFSSSELRAIGRYLAQLAVIAPTQSVEDIEEITLG